MRKRTLPALLLCLFGTSMLQAHNPQNCCEPTRKVNSFHLNQIKLLESPFQNAQNLDIRYLLELDADRLMAPYRKEAGLAPKAENYTNWENTGLDGHIGGHYVSALAQMYAATKDPRIKAKLDYALAELALCQEQSPDGYLCGVPGGKAMWAEIKAGNIRAGSFDLNHKWVPLYNIHKTYNALRDAYIYTGNEEAKIMLIKLSDWALDLVSNLSDEQIQDMLRSEYGGLNETFADVAAITGDQKYLKLARQFSHETILNPLIKDEDQLNGMHANTQIPKIIGFKRVSEVSNNQEWLHASKFFWDTVVGGRTISIGGNSVREHFHPANDFSSMLADEEGPETCNTYNMLRLTKMLYETSGESAYMDYYERALFNHILSSQHPETGGLVYFTPMRSGHYRVYSQPHTSFWCCVGSGLENHARYGEMIYGHKNDSLYVNLFINSELNWSEKNVEISQLTAFPENGKVSLKVNPKKSGKFTLLIRKPAWSNFDETTLNVNNKAVAKKLHDNYYVVERNWKRGDVVNFEMPMHLNLMQLPDQSQNYSVLYGPIVLGAEVGNEGLDGLYADDSRGGHVARGLKLPSAEMPIVVGSKESFLNNIRKNNSKPLSFNLSGVQPTHFNEIELKPFYQIHDARYVVYFPIASHQEYAKMQQEMADKDALRTALDAITVDKLQCGLQQPESDHFIQFENSYIGVNNDIHWRQAHGWFSYKLRNSNGKAAMLRVTYVHDTNSDRFEVLINGEKLAEERFENRAWGTVSIVEYQIPANLQKEERLEVTFRTSNQGPTERVSEVRITTK